MLGDRGQIHPDDLIELSMRGQLNLAEQAELGRHIAHCPDCAMEVEYARIFRNATAPTKGDAALDEAAVEQALVRLQRGESLLRKIQRWLGTWPPRRPRPALTFALVGVTAMAIVVLVAHQRKPVPLQAGAPRPVLLDDGSEITPVDSATTVQVAEQTPVRTTVRLRSGRAQFRVRHDDRRVFRVAAGPIEIEDLGTVFRVEHEAPGRVRVTVSEGQVAVLYPEEQVRIELAAGESRVFTAVPPSGAAQPATQQAPVEAQSPHEAPTPAAAVGRSAPRARTPESPSDLLLAADVARRSHQPHTAVTLLRRLVAQYPKDPRTPSAAFTLGWVLLNDLDRAREAAAAFTEAESVAPRGALSEDAAARIAEAWQRAGDPKRAAQAARHYEQTYPGGRYIHLMNGIGREH
jgi:ferric-dicitrate binding protein FerR (iron transport regulator)